MRRFIGLWFWLFAGLLIFPSSVPAQDRDGSSRFEKGDSSFGLQAGWGYTDDIPGGVDRTDLSFLFFFPNYQQNLTGQVGDSWYQGSLFWHVEAGFASVLNRNGEYLLGFSPGMVQYKFQNPKRNWAPNILAGVGFSYTNWKDAATRELGSEFQFLLHSGAGIEYYLGKNAISLNYRFFHVSNAGIELPNIGLNAHIFSLGFRF